MLRSDNDGWDDGGPLDEPLGFDDPFREEHPPHPPQPIAHVLGKTNLLRPWAEGDPPQPPPKPLRCDQCHKMFMSKAGWMWQKWNYAGLCEDCGNGNSLPPGFLAECKRPPIRQLACPKCGIRKGVEPTLHSNLWIYELTCSNCGTHAENHQRLRRTCAECGEDFFVDENRPRRTCAKCHKTKGGKSAY